MTLREYVDTFRSQWIVVVSIVVLGLLLGGSITLIQPDRYGSEVTFYVATRSSGPDSAAAYDGTLLAQEKVKSYVELLDDDRLADDVAARLGGSVDTSDIADAISAMSPPETSLIRMTVLADSPAGAQQLASAVADELVRLVADLEQPSDPRALPTVTIRIVRPASLSPSPVSPSLLMNLAVGGMLGLVVGLLAGLARSTLDTRVRTADTLSEIAGAPSLGSTVNDQAAGQWPLRHEENPNSPYAEALRHIRTNLGFVAVDRSCKVLVITSALQQEGKSSLVCSLATALGADGQRVAVVSADLRRPSIERTLHLEQSVGLTSVLSGRADLEHCLQRSGQGLFDVLAAGALPPNPSELLSSDRMRALMVDLRERYDVVLLDVPPILPVTDAALVAVLADGVILVGRHGSTTRKNFANAVQAVSMTPTPIVGVIMTAAPTRSASPYHYSIAAASEPHGSAAPDAAPVAVPGRLRQRRPSPVPLVTRSDVAESPEPDAVADHVGPPTASGTNAPDELPAPVSNEPTVNPPGDDRPEEPVGDETSEAPESASPSEKHCSASELAAQTGQAQVDRGAAAPATP